MKKILIVFMILMTLSSTACNSNGNKHNYITDSDYLTLIDMLNEPVMDDKEFIYDIYFEDNSTSKCTFNNVLNTYTVNIFSENKTFSHTINSNTIEVKDILTNETTTYLEDVNIASLEDFSEIILDSHSNEFSYYSMKDFIPTALQLANDPELEFHLDSSINDKKKYRLSGNLSTLNLDDDILHNILLNTSNQYKELYKKENLEISFIFYTDYLNTHFKSTFHFTINGSIITEIA